MMFPVGLEEVGMESLDFELLLAGVRARLKAVREEQGIYQALRPWVAHLEQITGYRTSANTALRQENGECGLSVEYLLAVAISEGVSPAWLLTGEGPKYVGHVSGDAARLMQTVVDRIESGEIPVAALYSLAHPERRRA